MTRIIAVASGKGGVGKTTTVSNLSAALARFQRSVVAVDGNTTTPNLGLNLGMALSPGSIQDVISGRVSIRGARHQHPDGFSVIPGDIAFERIMSPSPHTMVDAVYKLLGEAEFVLIDSAAGLGNEGVSALSAANELLLVVNPDLASLTDALKVIKMAERHETVPIGVVVNKVRNEGIELTSEEIESFLGVPVIGKVNEDYAVRKAVAERSPVVSHSPRSMPAQQFMSIAASLSGDSYRMRMPLFARLFGMFRA